MAVKATPYIRALQAILSKSIDERLELLKSIIPTAEKREVKCTESLVRELVRVITSVVKCSDVTPEQLALVAEFRARVDAFDPRNPANDKPRSAEDPESKPRLKPVPPKISDGYDSSFINVAEAIERVVTKYTSKPYYSDLENDRLIETFLGNGIPLDPKSVRAAYLAFAYSFKDRSGSLEKPFTSLFPSQAVWVQTALCSFINRNHVSVPTPNCLSFTDDLGFRC